MPRVHAGFGDDIDHAKACIVIFGGVRIQTKTNLANLRFGRKFAAAKSIDANLRARTGELVDGVFKLFRIVRQLRDLFRGQNVAECRAVGICVSDLRFVGDVDVNFDHVDLESYFPAMWPS